MASQRSRISVLSLSRLLACWSDMRKFLHGSRYAPAAPAAAKRYLTRGLARLVAAAASGSSGQTCFGIAAAHVGAHIRPGAAPEAGQVARRLDRPMRRRQQLQRQRHGAAGDRRMLAEAEQLLHADRQHRPSRRRSGSARGCPTARRNGSAPGWRSCAAVRAAPATSGPACNAPGSMRGKGRLARQERQQPVVQRSDQRRVRHIGPGRAEPAMQPAEPMAQRLGLLAPRQQRQPMLAQRHR